MTERTAFRLTNMGIFLGLVAGIVLVSVLDVSTTRRVTAYVVIGLAWVVALAMNTIEDKEI